MRNVGFEVLGLKKNMETTLGSGSIVGLSFFIAALRQRLANLAELGATSRHGVHAWSMLAIRVFMDKIQDSKPHNSGLRISLNGAVAHMAPRGSLPSNLDNLNVDSSRKTTNRMLRLLKFLPSSRIPVKTSPYLPKPIKPPLASTKRVRQNSVRLQTPQTPKLQNILPRPIRIT